MKRFALLFFLVILASCAPAPEAPVEENGFCGTSTNAPCLSDADCVADGCSGQICKGVSEESVITTCEWQDCYDKEKYSVSCGCVNGQCQWN